MAATVEIGSLIARTPGIRGGRPCIAGTGTSVRSIGVWNHYHGMTAEKIAADYPHLTLVQIYAALAYYYANREEMQQDLAANEAAEEEFLRHQAEVSK